MSVIPLWCIVAVPWWYKGVVPDGKARGWIPVDCRITFRCAPEKGNALSLDPRRWFRTILEPLVPCLQCRKETLQFLCRIRGNNEHFGVKAVAQKKRRGISWSAPRKSLSPFFGRAKNSRLGYTFHATLLHSRTHASTCYLSAAHT